MRAAILPAILFCLCATSGVAMARTLSPWAKVSGPGPPCCPTFTLPCAISLVCTDGRGNPDPAGMFQVVAKDSMGNTIPDAEILFDFSQCPDLSVCTVQVNTSAIVNCTGSTKQVIAHADANGALDIAILGGVAHRVSAPGTPGCCDVFINGKLVTDGVNKPKVAVSAFDLTGGDGLGNPDLSAWLTEFFANVYQQRDDYDRKIACSAAVGNPDLSAWLKSYFLGYTTGCNANGGSLCP